MTFSGAVSVLETRNLGNRNHLMFLKAPEVAAIIQPAQFVMLSLQHGTEPLLGRPFSVAQIGQGPGGPTLGLLFKVVGRATQILSQLNPGARLGLVGPLGQPFPAPGETDAPVFLVAGGIGIAPFPILAMRLHQQGFRTHLLYGARTRSDLVARDLFSMSCSEISVATEDGSEGFRGFISHLLGQVLDGLPRSREHRPLAYACGPPPMLAATDAVLGRRHVSGHLCVESFMACGFGVCLSCVVAIREPGKKTAAYRRVCVDGPSFPTGSIVWPRSKPR
ncbi:MAG: dihydroorotate dehydrogenase electron transfer subunit [Acidobacteriota bacterium]